MKALVGHDSLGCETCDLEKAQTQPSEQCTRGRRKEIFVGLLPACSHGPKCVLVYLRSGKPRDILESGE